MALKPGTRKPGRVAEVFSALPLSWLWTFVYFMAGVITGGIAVAKMLWSNDKEKDRAD